MSSWKPTENRGFFYGPKKVQLLERFRLACKSNRVVVQDTPWIWHSSWKSLVQRESPVKMESDKEMIEKRERIVRLLHQMLSQGRLTVQVRFDSQAECSKEVLLLRELAKAKKKIVDDKINADPRLRPPCYNFKQTSG